MKNLITLLLLTLSYQIFAQVVINEYSASNLNSFYDSFGKTEDWIELYNNSENPVDISDWHLSDKASKPKKWKIPKGTVIDPYGFIIFNCSGRDLVTDQREYHTNFKLAQTKNNEIVMLTNPEGEVIESFSMELTLVEHSRCRQNDGDTAWMVCTSPTRGTSNNTTGAKYYGYTTSPSVDIEAGYYSGNQIISLINNEPNSVLHYTTDGTNPTSTSPVYSDPINISKTQVIKAIAISYDDKILPGKMDFNTYLIDEDYTLAVFSVAADNVIDLANGEGELIPIGSIEYFNTDKIREATSFGSLNRHGQDSWVLDHRSLDWVSRDEMGYSKAVNAPLFSYSDRDEYQKFMFRNSGDDNYPAIDDGEHDGSTHIRDEYVHTLAMEGGMKLDQRAVERVILFLNGQYWGLYGMRERPVDHDYTDEYYDQGKYEIEYLTTWQSTEIQYGGENALNNWINLRDYILNTDMADPAAYKVATDSLNMLSLIDYFLINQNTVAADWLNYNTGWWRGLNPSGDHKKWGYIVWDLDATFDYYINYTQIPDRSPNANPCDINEISSYMDYFFSGQDNTSSIATCPSILNGSCPYDSASRALNIVMQFLPECCDEWGVDCEYEYSYVTQYLDTTASSILQTNVGAHEKIFIKLLEESPIFKQLYYSRFADMMNTTFSCENMNSTLDRMLAVIEPEMPDQINRWGGNLNEWKSNVDELKDFINRRCEILDDKALECYEDLSGPYKVTLIVEPEGIGEIDFNTLDIESFPWSGNYFGGMANKIKAKVFDKFEGQYQFSHWRSKSGNVIMPDNNSRRATLNLTDTDTLTAVFSLILDVQDLASAHKVSVFPNPTSGNISVQFELDKAYDVELTLYSAMGQRIINFNEINGRKQPGKHDILLQLNRDRLPSGIYILNTTFNDKSHSFKINVL